MSKTVNGLPRRIQIILAATHRGEIGFRGKIPWKLAGDLPRFRELTIGTNNIPNIVIMGRSTWLSLLPKGLPYRHVIVVTTRGLTTEERGTGNPPQEAVSFKAALLLAGEMLSDGRGNEVWIAGGARLYAEALRLPSRLHLTAVHNPPDLEYDAVVPDFDLSGYMLLSEDSVKTVFKTADNGMRIPTHSYLTYVSYNDVWPDEYLQTKDGTNASDT